MTAPDRTGELIRAMLERRAGSAPPDWLLDRTIHGITTSGQRRRAGPLAIPRPSERLVLAATLVLLLGLIVGAALVVGGFLDRPSAPEQTQPAIEVIPTGSPVPTAEPPVPTATPETSPKQTPGVVPDVLGPDTLAIVTEEGDRLRVRTAPGVGADSLKLTPLLSTGTRLLVVGGPVPADGFDWYQVLADNQPSPLFGWVASGADGKPWIRSTLPTCRNQLDARAVLSMQPIDFLLCYGSQPVDLRVTAAEGLAATGEEWCPWTAERGHCAFKPSWMNSRVWLVVDAGDGTSGGIGAVVSPDLAWDGLPESPEVTVRVAADAPEAQDCRIVDEAGRDVVPAARAALECRFLFVIRDVSSEAVVLSPDSMAMVVADELEAWSVPGDGGSATRGRLQGGERVYIDQGATRVDGTDWYAVLTEDFQRGVYGWVPASQGGQPTLVPDQPRCASPEDWEAFVNLSRVERLTCVDAQPIVLDMWVQDLQAPRPDWSTACDASAMRPSTVPGATCVATPSWLASFIGITVRRPGDMEAMAAIDPTAIDRTSFPSTPTWMQVTGSFERAESATCRARDAASGQDLLMPAEAAIYCRATFVITALGPATTTP